MKSIDQKTVETIRLLAADGVQKPILDILDCQWVQRQWHMSYGRTI